MLLLSCRGAKYKHWKGTAAGADTFRSYFDSTHTSAKYKAEVSIFGKNFSGIIYFKFRNDTTCRAAFITIPGAKLFDLELTPRTDTVYACLEQLNHAGVIRTIESHIRTFLMLDNYEGDPQRLTDAQFKGAIWRRSTPEHTYHFYQPTGEPITKIELLDKKLKKKSELTASHFTGSLPANVQIEGTYTLSIHLTQIQ